MLYIDCVLKLSCLCAYRLENPFDLYVYVFGVWETEAEIESVWVFAPGGIKTFVYLNVRFSSKKWMLNVTGVLVLPGTNHLSMKAD